MFFAAVCEIYIPISISIYISTELYWESEKTASAVTSEMMADHSGSTMEADAARPSSASSRICTPPPPDMPCPTAENWCYTQVHRYQHNHHLSYIVSDIHACYILMYHHGRSKWWNSHTCGQSTTSVSAVRRWERCYVVLASLLVPMTNWNG